MNGLAILAVAVVVLVGGLIEQRVNGLNDIAHGIVMSFRTMPLAIGGADAAIQCVVTVIVDAWVVVGSAAPKPMMLTAMSFK